MRVRTDSYKGVRDFYPEDKQIEDYIFSIWREVVKSFGYEEYDASVLEESELYEAKSGEEIVSEQTYNFVDRGDRRVTLRPEMTPTVARMVAAKRHDLTMPLRWFSIPNLFRYERPQRGRLREHWQLNVDIFGVNGIEAEVELLEIAHRLLLRFGLTDKDFTIKVNDREIIKKFIKEKGFDKITAHKFQKLLDKKEKINDFSKQVEDLVGEKIEYNPEANEKITSLLNIARERGISNIVYDSTIMRGFDYYTGIVFEIFDNNPENNRSIFGGGRYDSLMDIFDAPNISAVGFGMGDVVVRDILETYKLLPQIQSSADLYICILEESFIKRSLEIASQFREAGIKVAVDYSFKKVGDQVKVADRKKIPFVVCIGEDEIENNKILVKSLNNQKSFEGNLEDSIKFVKNSL